MGIRSISICESVGSNADIISETFSISFLLFSIFESNQMGSGNNY